MAKEAIKRTGTAITEAALRSVMPELNDTLKAIREDIRAVSDDLQKQIRALDVKTDALRDEMIERFERMLNTVKEVSHRVTKLDGRIEGHMEAMRLTLRAPAAARPSRKRTAG